MPSVMSMVGMIITLFTYFGHMGPHIVYLQFKQHPLVKGLCPPLNLPVTYNPLSLINSPTFTAFHPY